jgi:hypothetical protein
MWSKFICCYRNAVMDRSCADTFFFVPIVRAVILFLRNVDQNHKSDQQKRLYVGLRENICKVKSRAANKI